MLNNKFILIICLFLYSFCYSLTVEKTDIDGVDKAYKLWRSYLDNSNIDKIKEHPLYEDFTDTFSYLGEIIEDIHQKQDMEKLKNPYYFIAKDNNNIVQGIMILDYKENPKIESRAIEILILITAPWNVFTHSPVRGAGVALVQQAKAQALLLMVPKIYLYPTKSAVEFYIKRGFKYEIDEALSYHLSPLLWVCA